MHSRLLAACCVAVAIGATGEARAAGAQTGPLRLVCRGMAHRESLLTTVSGYFAEVVFSNEEIHFALPNDERLDAAMPTLWVYYHAGDGTSSLTHGPYTHGIGRQQAFRGYRWHWSDGQHFGRANSNALGLGVELLPEPEATDLRQRRYFGLHAVREPMSACVGLATGVAGTERMLGRECQRVEVQDGEYERTYWVCASLGYAILREQRRRVLEDVTTITTKWYLDHREMAPGLWLPRRYLSTTVHERAERPVWAVSTVWHMISCEVNGPLVQQAVGPPMFPGAVCQAAGQRSVIGEAQCDLEKEIITHGYPWGFTAAEVKGEEEPRCADAEPL